MTLDRFQVNGTLAAGEHLATASRAFNVHVLGPDRPRIVESCLKILSHYNAGRRTSARQRTRATATALAGEDFQVDLSLLPPPLVQRVLHAFAMEFHPADHSSGLRLALKVSACLHGACPAPSDLRLEVDDDWPILTPQAAGALLRLMMRVADRRGITISPRGA